MYVIIYSSADGCEPGSWSPTGTPQCSLCAVGTFNDAFGSTKCTPCPGAKSTIEEGASSIDQCKGIQGRS